MVYGAENELNNGYESKAGNQYPLVEQQTLSLKSPVTGIWIITGEESFMAAGMLKPYFSSHSHLITFNSKSDPILDEMTMTQREFKCLAHGQLP